ncbi:MAG: hypothetical protein ACK504_02915 [Bacteroidota bacterium]
MQYFDLIFDECKKLNEILDKTFRNNELFFIDANIAEITYGLDKDAIVFCYYPERHEYGKIMLLKDVFIRLSFDMQRQYSISQLYSFFQNNFKFYEESSKLIATGEYIDLIQSVLHLLNLNKNEWEEKFILYKKSITPKWD